MKQFATLALSVAAVAAPGPLFAIPPIGPQDGGAVARYMQATEKNDLPAYAALFATAAEVTVEGRPAVTKANWIESVREDFVPARQTRFLSVIGSSTYENGRLGARVVLTLKEQHCRPPLIECFPTYRTETIKVADGKIVALHRSMDFTHGLPPDGVWTSFMEDVR